MKEEKIKSDIASFFNPKSIAIVGASEIKDKVGGILLTKAMSSKAKIIPINPKHEEIFGIKCYKSVLDYEKSIDLGIIAIPAPLVAGALVDCGKKGIKNIILISAGFSEIGNLNGEEELSKIAKNYGMNVLGPNCFGIFSPKKNLDTTFSATTPKKGNIAFISQSGALWSYIADFSIDKFGFSGFVSLGNMMKLEFPDFLEYFLNDSKTKFIVLYVEKLKDGKKLMTLAKKSKKKIYVVKAGKSEKGSEATFSHTASLASDYEIYRGAFKQAGIELCSSIEEAFSKASRKDFKFNLNKETRIGKRVFIVTNAGGCGALMSDYLSEKGFEIFDKPLDIIGTATGSDYFNNLEKIKANSSFDAVICILTSQSMTEIKKTAEVIVNFKLQTGRIIIPIFLGDKIMKEANKIFKQAGISYFNTLLEAKSSLVF